MRASPGVATLRLPDRKPKGGEAFSQRFAALRFLNAGAPADAGPSREQDPGRDDRRCMQARHTEKLPERFAPDRNISQRGVLPQSPAKSARGAKVAPDQANAARFLSVAFSTGCS